MTRIKICGITNPEDARAAVEFGADALGFIAVEESPRYVSPEEVHEIFGGLGPFVPVVTVARTVADAQEYTDANFYTEGLVQFYEGSTQGIRGCVRAFRIKDGSSLTAILEYHEPVQAIHLDTYQESALGGIGKTFDWQLAVAAKSLARGTPIILAGGLTPENVGEAIAAVRPYAVDVSSGVEAEPGRKSHSKVKAFIRAVREADRRIDEAL